MFVVVLAGERNQMHSVQMTGLLLESSNVHLQCARSDMASQPVASARARMLSPSVAHRGDIYRMRRVARTNIYRAAVLDLCQK